MLAYAELPASLEQAFALASAEPVSQVIAWVNARVLSAAPAERASLRDYLAASARELAALGCVPDVAAVNARLAELAAREHQRPVALTLSHDGARA